EVLASGAEHPARHRQASSSSLGLAHAGSWCMRRANLVGGVEGAMWRRGAVGGVAGLHRVETRGGRAVAQRSPGASRPLPAASPRATVCPMAERIAWVGRVTVPGSPREHVVRLWTDGEAPGPHTEVEEIDDPFAATNPWLGGDPQAHAHALALAAPA